MRTLLLVLCCPLLAACPGGGEVPSDASCSMGLALGTGDAASFSPLSDGDAAEVVLGFQGFRMLVLALRLDGARSARAEVSGYLTVPESGVEIAQLPRMVALRDGTDGSAYAEELLVFFNETPASEVVGREAELELIARADGCVGTTRVTLALRDDDDCVEYGIELDAGTADAGPLDAGAACGATP